MRRVEGNATAHINRRCSREQLIALSLHLAS